MELFAHLHPKLVHFPIALFTSALIFEILSYIFNKENFHQTAYFLYVFAAFSSPLVVQTGIWEAEEHHLRHSVLDQHKLFALWAMWSSLISLPILWFIRTKNKQYFRSIFAVFLILIVSCVLTASHHGGRLVFEYGIGIEE